MNANYIYYYKTDSSCEPVGRMNAIDIDDAMRQIAIIKQLSIDLIKSLFVIKCVKGDRDENDI